MFMQWCCTYKTYCILVAMEWKTIYFHMLNSYYATRLVLIFTYKYTKCVLPARYIPALELTPAIEIDLTIAMIVFAETVLQVTPWILVNCVQCVEKSSSKYTVTMPVSLDLPNCVYLLCSMESQLTEFERRHNIICRWKSTDPEYDEARQRFLKEKKEQLQSSLWASVVRQHYLLKMKAKYAGEFVCRQLMLYTRFSGNDVITCRDCRWAEDCQAPFYGHQEGVKENEGALGWIQCYVLTANRAIYISVCVRSGFYEFGILGFPCS